MKAIRAKAMIDAEPIIRMLLDAMKDSEFYPTASVQSDFVDWLSRLSSEKLSQMVSVLVNSDNTITIKMKAGSRRLLIDLLGMQEYRVAIYEKIDACNYSTTYLSRSKAGQVEAMCRVEDNLMLSQGTGIRFAQSAPAYLLSDVFG